MVGIEADSPFSSVRDKTAIVTGAAQGIGLTIVREFAKLGARVMLCDNQKDRGEAAVRDISAQGGNVRFCHVDAGSEADLSKLVEQTLRSFNSLDFVINNARPALSRARYPDSMGSWDDALDVMVKGPAVLIAKALPHLKASGSASVVNIASINAYLVCDQPVTYHVAKAAQIQLTRYLAHELGPQGIRVNAVCPGLVDQEDGRTKLTDRPGVREVTQAIVPMQRAASPREIAWLAAFLCSSAARYITGQAIVLDGGMANGDQFDCAMKVLERFDAKMK